MNGEEGGDHPAADSAQSNDGHYPMDMHLGGPAIPEETDGDQNASRDERRKSEFRLRLAVISCDEEVLDLVGEGTEARNANEGSNANTDVNKSGGALTEMVGGFVYFGDGGKEQIEVAENHSYEHAVV